MKEGKDGSGNIYIEVNNIRVTQIPVTWAGVPGLRIQAYTGEGKKLHKGAEIPISKNETILDLISAIITLTKNKD